MGESVAEATIIRWLKSPGDHIEADEAIMEIATDKVDSEVPSPVTGILAAQLCKDNDVVQVGAVIAIIDTEVFKEKEAPATTPAPVTPVTEAPAPVAEAPKAEEHNISGISQLPSEPLAAQTATYSNSERFYSPLVKNIAVQENISTGELDKIPGTGAEGRLTKDDLLNYVNYRKGRIEAEQNKQAPVSPSPEVKPAEPQVPAEQAVPQQVIAETPKPVEQAAALEQQPIAPLAASPAPELGTPEPQPAPVAEPAATPVKPAYSVSGGDEIIEMDRMRKLIADHMVMSKHTSPHVTSFVEADVTNMVKWREQIKKGFEDREGERITFTPIFIQAVVKAIKDMPLINSSVYGTQILKKKDINIGMATALPSGNLIVPVIHKADSLNLSGLTKAVNDLANRARGNKLVPDEIKNGTFTITNVGSFGNVMGTPIINQPQVAILALGIIKKKPAVLETKDGDVIAIRHMMYLSLSYDHRVVDGALGGSFVRRVADYLENWDVNTVV